MSQDSLLAEFKEFMSIEYSGYSLTSETDNTLHYKKEIPASSGNCGTAGCLFLLGILPGIIYYFLSKKDAQVLTVNATLNSEGELIISGDNALKITNQFDNY
jgi:hypothetical protein